MVSSALLAAAGNHMQYECNMKLKGRTQITPSEVVVTRGYNLPAKHVFHVVIPGYKNDNFQHYEAFVKNCLKKADELDMSSIAFPAIGTGKLRYPPNIAASKMFQAVEEVAAATYFQYLKEVNFVIFPTDENVLQHIWNTMQNSNTDAFDNRKDVSQLSNTFPLNERPIKKKNISFLDYMQERPNILHKTKDETVIKERSKIIFEPNEDSIIQKQINTFKKRKKDLITQKKTNIFHNPNKDLMIKERSTTLQNRKEESLPQETQKLFQKPNEDLIIQEVPKISCHLKEEKKIHENDKILSHPNDDSIIRVRPKILYKQTEDSIIDDNSIFIDRPKNGSIMKERTNILHKPKEDSISLITKEGIKVFVYKANICYLSNIDCIVNISNSKMNDMTGSTNIVFEAGDKTKKECSQYIKGHGKLDEKCVCSTTAGNLSHYRKIFHVNYNPPIWRASLDIKETSDNFSAVIKICLAQANTDNMASIAFSPIIPLGLYAVWKKSLVGTYPESIMKFSAEDGMRSKIKEIHFVDTDQAVVDCLQVTFLQTISDIHQSIKGNDEGMGIGLLDLKKFHTFNTYTTTMKSIFSELNEERSDTAVKYQSDRDMNVPSNWTQMDAKEMITTVVLQPHDQEYKDVVDKFKHRSAALYGNGVYFAEYPSYSSMPHYAKPDQNNNKRVYLCKVLVGEYAKGERSMRVPPQKPGASGSHILYDSVVDNQSSPEIFVIFHDTQAYPDYLIVFR
ncbi:unnamed protein product [Mytilus coruscus]|uniref:Poly [ADP-ribose] polymerase n=1 Tax=Mytilus coruscus TaxID=42192 RepID=A0A6J8C8R1_MYTCO|nr:unnamed protein product [Mytilus coruscus]